MLTTQIKNKNKQHFNVELLVAHKLSMQTECKLSQRLVLIEGCA